MKNSDVRYKILYDTIKNTIIVNIEKSLKQNIKDDERVKKIMKSFEQKIDSIIGSEKITIENKDFRDQKEFENYVLSKSNEIRSLLISEMENTK